MKRYRILKVDLSGDLDIIATNMKTEMQNIFGRRLIHLLIALMLIAQIATPAVVLCHGEDGHVAVELAHHGNCSEDSDDFSGAFGFSDVLSFRGNTGTCIDIPLRNDSVVHYSFSFQKVLGKFFGAFSLTPISKTTSVREMVPSDLSRIDNPIADSAQRALRTVILLI